MSLSKKYKKNLSASDLISKKELENYSKRFNLLSQEVIDLTKKGCKCTKADFLKIKSNGDEMKKIRKILKQYKKNAKECGL